MNHKSSKMPKIIQKIVERKTVRRKKGFTAIKKSSEPEYMIQVPDPKMVRKDILESLRELIIFMQGYEKFRKIQNEKVSALKQLQSQVRELNSLIDVKLRGLLPKGNMHAVKEMHGVRSKTKVPEVKSVESEVVKPKSELDELESQLKDIESQLHGLK